MTSPPETGAFREHVRAWFNEHRPQHWLDDMLRANDHEQLEYQLAWLRTLALEGFHAPHVPKELGGGGLAIADRAILYEEWARSGAPPLALFSVSLYHLPSTLMAAGTPEQQQRYIPGALSGEIWCQGFSEPDSGSDLASLRTRAKPVEGGYLVTGRKIWSSHASHASFCLLLARSSDEPRKQAGITYLIVDMNDPGVAVTPIVQSTGQPEFCEVTFDNVFVAAEQRIGAEGEGWQIAQRTLSTERGPLALEIVERIDLARRGLLEMPNMDAEWGADMADMAAKSLALRFMARDLIERLVRSEEAGGLSSILKVESSEFLRAVTSLGSIAAGEQSFETRAPVLGTSWISGHWMTDYLNSWGWSIGAGSNEIQRNIIAERLLRMPTSKRRSA